VPQFVLTDTLDIVVVVNDPLIIVALVEVVENGVETYTATGEPRGLGGMGDWN
jgi:hypothetical protein